MANKRIDTTAVIERVRLQEQGADPSNPSAGYAYLYAKSDGIYLIQDDGKVLGPIGVKYYTFTVPGELAVDSGLLRIYNLTGKALNISKVHLGVNTAPTGASIIVDIHENGTTIFTTQGNRPAIVASAFTGQSTTIDDPSWANGNYLQADVDQIGSAVKGEDLTITVVAS